MTSVLRVTRGAMLKRQPRNLNCSEIKKATDLNNRKAERLQLCPINKSHKAEQQVSCRTPLACLPGRKPSDQFNTDTELPLCAYYRSRHKTTGARNWMSIPGILGLVYTPLNILKFSVLPQWSYTWQHTKTTSDLSYELCTQHFTILKCHNWTCQYHKPICVRVGRLYLQIQSRIHYRGSYWFKKNNNNNELER